MSDTDDTAEPGVKLTINRVEVVSDDSDRFVHRITAAIAKDLASPSQWIEMPGRTDFVAWARNLGSNLASAAHEEMRVRLSAERVDALMRRVTDTPRVPGHPIPWARWGF